MELSQLPSEGRSPVLPACALQVARKYRELGGVIQVRSILKSGWWFPSTAESSGNICMLQISKKNLLGFVYPGC